jgi:hypothetical protein
MASFPTPPPTIVEHAANGIPIFPDRATTLTWLNESGEHVTTTAAAGATPADTGKAYHLVRAAFEIPGVPRVTNNLTQFGTTAKDYIAWYFKALQEILSWKAKLSNSTGTFATGPGYVLQGGHSLNWCDGIIVKGTVTGKTVVIDNAAVGYQDPGDFSIMTGFTPAPETEGGTDPEYTFASFSIRVGQSKVTDYQGGFAFVTAVDYGATTTTLTLSHTIAQGSYDVGIWDNYGDAETWDYVFPAERHWSTRTDTGWVAVANPAAAQTQELLGMAGESQAISWPVAWATGVKGTFKVEARHSNGSVSNETAYFLAGFPGLTAKVWIAWAAGFFSSWVFLDKHLTDTTITHYRITYCPNVDPLTYDAADTAVKARCLWKCANCRYDATGAMGTAGTSGRVTWAGVDAGGRSWFCSQANSGADISEWNTRCTNTRCPKFDSMNTARAEGDSIHGGWRLSTEAWRALWLAADVYTQQIVLGGGPVFATRPEYGGRPSICWQGGLPTLPSDGLQTPRITNVTAGLLGHLDTSHSADDPYYKLKSLFYDTLPWAEDVTAPGSPVGGLTYDDGTDAAEQMEAHPGSRHFPAVPAYAPSDIVGAGESDVQRAVAKRFTIEISVAPAMVDVRQDFCNGHHGYLRADRILEVHLARERYWVEASEIPADAAYLHDWALPGDGTIVFYAQPGVDWSLAATDGVTTLTPYVTSRFAVNAPEGKRSRNYGGLDIMTGIGDASKARAGRVLNLVGAEGGLDAVGLMIIAAEAASLGSLKKIYDGPVPGTSGTCVQKFVPGAAFHPLESGNSYSVTSVKYSHTAAAFTGAQNLPYGTGAPDNAYDYAKYYSRGYGSADGALIPSHGAASTPITIAGLLPAIFSYRFLGGPLPSYTVHYTIAGDDTTARTRTMPCYSLNAAAGGVFYSVPCIPLTGEPDLTGTAPLLEWFNTSSDAWEDTGFTMGPTPIWDADAAPGSVWYLAMHGYWHVFKYNGKYFGVFPVELWDKQCRLTYTRTAGSLGGLTLDQPPTGLGHPAAIMPTDPDYTEAGDDRLAMDWIQVPEDTAVTAYLTLLGHPLPAGLLSIGLSGAAVLAPMIVRDSTGAVVPTTRTLSIWHMAGFEGTETPIAAMAEDSCAGILTFDVSAWSAAQRHYLCFQGDRFLETPNSFWAGTLLNLEKAIAALKTFSVGMSGTRKLVAAVYAEQPLGPDFVAEPVWSHDPATVGTFGIADLARFPFDETHTYTDALAEVSESHGTLYSNDNYLSLVNAAMFNWDLTVATLIPPPMLTEHAECIEAAYLPFEIVDGQRYTRHKTFVLGGAVEETDTGPFDLAPEDIRFVAIRLEPFKTLDSTPYFKATVLGSGSEYVGTVLHMHLVVEGERRIIRGMADMTGPLTALAAYPQQTGVEYVIAPVGAGSLPPSGDFQGLCATLFRTWTTTWADVDGYATPQVTAFDYEFDSFLIPEVSYGTGFVSFNEAGVIASAPPVSPGLMPPLRQPAAG